MLAEPHDPPRAIADFEPLRACFTAWPHHAYAFGDHLARAQHETVAFCRALCSVPGGELLELLCDDAAAEAEARARLADLGDRVSYRRLRYGDVWLRDTTPLFARTGAGGLALVRMTHTGWGGKYLYPNDAELAVAFADALGLPCSELPLALEGGALEFDGRGSCMTTDCCAINENRNPGLGRADVEQRLERALGITHVIWLREGLAFDHTDGHIDNIARFAAPGLVVHMEPSGPSDPNRERLREIARELGAARDATESPLQLVSVPSPGAVRGDDGALLPASYLNFYIGNRCVVVPAFGAPSDEAARRALAEVCPDRECVSSPARSLLDGGGGTFHCMTRGEPATGARA